MRLFSTLGILLIASPLFAAEPAKKGLFKSLTKEQITKVVENMPRVTMEEVGIITTPLPDREGFTLPGRWRAVKMIDEASVYIVKDANRFLHPTVGNTSRTTYTLWGNLRGESPEIVVWHCLGKKGRAAKIAGIEKTKLERKARAEQRRKDAEKDREIRGEERQLRTKSRQQARARAMSVPNRKHAVSQARHRELLGMQQPLADAVLDRVTSALATGSGKVSSFSMDEESMVKVRQNVMATMAIQLQMRDIQWCDAIEKHLTPGMWSRNAGHDALKKPDPETVISWLVREIERQTERAETQIHFEAELREERKAMDAEMRETSK